MFLCSRMLYFIVFLTHPFRDEELEAQILQSSVQMGCNLLVFLPGLLQPLEGDKD